MSYVVHVYLEPRTVPGALENVAGVARYDHSHRLRGRVCGCVQSRHDSNGWFSNVVAERMCLFLTSATYHDDTYDTYNNGC